MLNFRYFHSGKTNIYHSNSGCNQHSGSHDAIFEITRYTVLLYSYVECTCLIVWLTVSPPCTVDEPDDCYVQMQLGPDAFATDTPEPIYAEMNTKEFIKPPPEKPESLYYATKDLFQHRKDLQVNVRKLVQFPHKLYIMYIISL